MTIVKLRGIIRYRTSPYSVRQGSSWINAYLGGDFPTRQGIIQTQLVPLLKKDLDALTIDLSKAVGGVSTAIQLRIDLQKLTEDLKNPDLTSLDKITQSWLSAAFCVDSLTLQRVTFDSSGSTLETIARADTVHAVRSISALKKRFEVSRRCYALFHHSLPNFPIAFIHVGLTSQLANSMSALDQWKDGVSPTHAMFYSVNSTSPAFRGLSLAPHLIKEVVQVLQKDIPSIHTFSTLSPIPTFTKWLSRFKDVASVPRQHMERIQEAAALLNGKKSTNNAEMILPAEEAWLKVTDALLNRPGDFDSNVQLQSLLREPLEWLACRCVLTTRIAQDGSLAMQEPVANFHMSNGAEFHRVNFMGNPSLAGLKASVGMMVNYLYRLDTQEQNARLYLPPVDGNTSTAGLDKTALALGPSVRKILNVQG